MKRNWDVVRKILVRLEEQTSSSGSVESESFGCFDNELVAYHMERMDEGGLIKAKCSKGRTMSCIALSMTWEGHEFLDKISNETVWQKVKGSAREKGVDLSIDLIKGLAMAYLKSMFGLPD